MTDDNNAIQELPHAFEARLQVLDKQAMEVVQRPKASGVTEVKDDDVRFQAESEALMLASLMYPPHYLMRTGHDWGDDWNGLPEACKAKLPKGWDTSGYGVARYLAACRVQQLLRDTDNGQTAIERGLNGKA